MHRFVETAVLWLSKLSNKGPFRGIFLGREPEIYTARKQSTRTYHRTALRPGSWAKEYASGQTTNRLTTAVKPKPTG